MKILAGHFKNRNIYMPEGIRPTQHITRKSIFDILGQDLTGRSFCDIFAGSGAMGLEALSRGAEQVVFVEKDRFSMDVIEENLRRIRDTADTESIGAIEIIAQDAFAAMKKMAREGRVFDIVFIDPPYRRGQAKKALKTLGAHVILQPNSTLIIQHDRREILPASTAKLSAFRQSTFGKTLVSFYQVKKLS